MFPFFRRNVFCYSIRGRASGKWGPVKIFSAFFLFHLYSAFCFPPEHLLLPYSQYGPEKMGEEEKNKRVSIQNRFTVF